VAGGELVDVIELMIGWQTLSIHVPSSRPTARQSESVLHCVRAASNKIVQALLVLEISTKPQIGANRQKCISLFCLHAARENDVSDRSDAMRLNVVKVSIVRPRMYSLV
jgi:hypothetical protein